MVAKKEEELGTADNIFELLLNRFGSGKKGHQAMTKNGDESIDQFLDDLESMRRRNDPEEFTNSRNFKIASKFIDGVKSDDLSTVLETYYTLSIDNAPNPEEMRQNLQNACIEAKDIIIFDRPEPSRGSEQQRSTRYKPKNDMDKCTSCKNCGSADHHVAKCTSYKQGMKSLGYAPD